MQEQPDPLAMQRYRDRCQTLVVELSGVLPAAVLDQAQHLIDHGEPSIGLEGLAWVAVKERAALPQRVIDELRSLVLDGGELPEGLDALAIGDGE